MLLHYTPLHRLSNLRIIHTQPVSDVAVSFVVNRLAVEWGRRVRPSEPCPLMTVWMWLRSVLCVTVDWHRTNKSSSVMPPAACPQLTSLHGSLKSYLSVASTLLICLIISFTPWSWLDELAISSFKRCNICKHLRSRLDERATSCACRELVEPVRWVGFIV